MQLPLDSTLTPLNLDYTLNCGQVFRWEKHGDDWYGVVDETIVKLRQIRTGLFFTTFPENRGRAFIQRYLRLSDDLPQILSVIEKDKDLTRRRDGISPAVAWIGLVPISVGLAYLVFYYTDERRRRAAESAPPGM